MKYFLILFTFIYSLSAFANREIGFDISTMKNQTSKPSSPKAGYKKIYFKNEKLTSIDSDGLEGQIGKDENLLINPSFESGAYGWTCSSSAAGVNTDSLNVVSGVNSLRVGLGVDIRGCIQYFAVPVGLVDVPNGIEISVWMRSTENSELCYSNNSVMDCIEYIGGSGLREMKMARTATSAAYGANIILIRSKTNNTGMMFMDNAYSGIARTASDKDAISKKNEVNIHTKQSVMQLQTISTGAIADLDNGNQVSFSAPGGTAITLNNAINGGVYNVFVTDGTARTYTFTINKKETGALALKCSPVIAATTASKHAMFTFTRIGDNAYCSWTGNL